MSREQTDPKLVQAVEEEAFHRIKSLSDKELLAKFPTLTRTTLYRIMKRAKLRFRAEVKQTSHLDD